MGAGALFGGLAAVGVDTGARVALGDEAAEPEALVAVEPVFVPVALVLVVLVPVLVLVAIVLVVPMVGLLAIGDPAETALEHAPSSALSAIAQPAAIAVVRDRGVSIIEFPVRQ